MAFTLQWANTVNDRTESELLRLRRPSGRFRSKIVTKAYHERIKFMSPIMCVQADVLYPNAWAAVKNIGPDGIEHNNSGEEEVYAVGCKGHQVDNDFPFEPRIPVALPLLQYPTDTQGNSTQEQDMCALPVLNWETYITEFSKSTNTMQRRLARTRGVGWRREKSVANARAVAASRTGGTGDGDDPQQDQESELELNQELSQSQEMVDLEDSNHDNLVSAPLCEDDIEIESFQSTQPAPPPPLQSSATSSKQKNYKPNKKFEAVPLPVIIGPDSVFKRKKIFTKLRQQRKPINHTPTVTRYHIMKILHRNNNDIELEERDGPGPAPAQDEKTFDVESELKFKPNTADLIPLSALRKYKNQPDLKIMGTWNFMYGGNGACEWVYDSTHSERRNILVGSGTNLRMATIKPAERTSMLSYVIDSVWEEDEVPTNIDPLHPQKNDVVSDVITRIVAPRKKGMRLATVQRGRSVEIYHIEETPILVTSISNTLYGTKRYPAGKHHVTGNPLLISCDANPVFPSEVITMDENNVLRLIDFVAKKTKRQFHGEKKSNSRSRQFGKPYSYLYPEFKINEGGGVAYATHPSTFYQWCDSQIYFHDERTPIESMTTYTELLNLRAATSSMSWSDQQYYTTNPKKLVSEYISNVKPSPNSTYYYVGTSERILLMDMRVPGNPVLKMNHGMKSAATYMSILKDKNFEVLIAGSQRVPQTFCSIHDFAHVNCLERPECQARNPVLQSHPRHLSNSREFFEYANSKDLGFGWECDYQRVREQCYAWTTGLCVLHGLRAPDPRKPPGVIVLNSNSYGDIFYQEWDPAPIDERRETEIDSRRLKKFVSGWTKAMTPANFNTFRRPSENRYFPQDCSMLIEPNAEAVRLSGKVRTKPFDPLTPYSLTYNRVDQKLKTVNEQIQILKKFTGPQVDKFLRQWADHSEPFEENGGIEANVVTGEETVPSEGLPEEEPEPEPEPDDISHEMLDFKQELDMDLEEPEEYEDPLLQTHEVEIQPSTSNSDDVNEILNAQNTNSSFSNEMYGHSPYDQVHIDQPQHAHMEHDQEFHHPEESEVMIVEPDPNQPVTTHPVYHIVSPTDEFTQNAQAFEIEGEDGSRQYFWIPVTDDNATELDVNDEEAEAEAEAVENAYVIEQNILASEQMFQHAEYDDNVNDEDEEIPTSSQYVGSPQFEPTDLSKAGEAFSISYVVPSPGQCSTEHKPDQEELESRELRDSRYDDLSDCD